LLITSVKWKGTVFPEAAATAAKQQYLPWKRYKIKTLAALSPTCPMAFSQAQRDLGLVVQLNCKHVMRFALI